MKTKLPAKLRHLNGAMHLLPMTEGQGMCFHRSFGLVLDVPQARLFVGMFRAATPEEQATTLNASPVPFIHCWTEIGGWIYAPTTIEAKGGRLRPMPRDDYYRINGTTILGSLTRKQVINLSREYGLAEHLLYHTPVQGGRAFADVILDALGVDYTLTEAKGVVPMGSSVSEPIPL